MQTIFYQINNKCKFYKISIIYVFYIQFFSLKQCLFVYIKNIDLEHFEKYVQCKENLK